MGGNFWDSMYVSETYLKIITYKKIEAANSWRALSTAFKEYQGNGAPCHRRSNRW